MAYFNKRTGEWEGLEPPRLGGRPAVNYSGGVSSSGYSSYTTYSSSNQRSSSRSLFSAINGVVQNIGYGIGRVGDITRNVVSVAGTILLVLVGVGALIALAVDGHWIVAILVGLFLGAVYFYVAAALALVVAWAVFIPFAILRYIFYNLWSLIATVGLICYLVLH